MASLAGTSAQTSTSDRGFSIAYSPQNRITGSNELMGKGSVLRGGFAMVYDQYGNDMVYNIDQSGSPGLASTVTQPINTNFTNSARYAGLSSSARSAVRAARRVSLHSAHHYRRLR